jgi:GDPmannose 4,6-dehydratase
MKTALITGITGQDGYHLAKLLLSKNYKVYGLINGQRLDRSHELKLSLPRVEQLFGDLSDSSSILSAIQKTQPDEIYNLGAISFVGLSFTQPEHTANITGLSLLRILEAVRALGLEKKVRIYQASSSEMFGKVRETPQTEQTPFHPRSPYGVAKVFAHYTATNYREAYGMHVSCGILFNHEGENRGNEFVTRKITQTVARIKLGLESELRLGALTPQRDWGYANDYVEAMWLMLQQDQPGDYVIATGETHTVREFVELAFELAGLEGEADRYLVQDERFMRPSEVDLLVGDATKARQILGWTPRTSFRELVKIMIDNDLHIESTKSPGKL